MNRSGRFTLTLMVFCFVLLAFGIKTQAQTAEFTYRGTLDHSMLANASYDFQFTLFDAPSGGASFGVRSRPGIYVNAVWDYTVSLDFGTAAFDGSARYLEIEIRPAGTPDAFTLLSPRALVTSAPYAIRSLSAGNSDIATTATNATQLGGVTANQYVQTNDARLSDPRAPLPNSSNYIQNTTTQQASSNFNIGGTGKANIFDAATQYNIAGLRVLTIGDFGSTFLGIRTGTPGIANTFVGYQAGQFATGWYNSFFGTQAGANSTYGYNSFFGYSAGVNNTIGEDNTAVGFAAGPAFGDLSNATAIGAFASVTQSNSLVLGSITGVQNAAADTKVGIGITAPFFKLHIIDPSNAGLRVQTNATGGAVASFGGNGGFQIDAPSVPAGRLQVLENGNVGIATATPAFKLHIIDSSNKGIRVQTNSTGGTVASYGGNGDFQVDASGVVGGRFVIKENGKVGIGNPNPNDKLNVAGNVSLLLSAGGATQVCQNSLAQLSTCGSSLRYKTNVNSFSFGLSLLNRLRPVSFNWKANNLSDFGLVAEEVEQVEPLLVTHNEKGEVEGVKYDRLGVVLINAVKEQQAQIKRQQEQIEALTKLVCSMNANAEICKKKQ